MSTIINYALNKIKNKIDENCEDGNISASERVLSVIAGGFIIGIGAKRLLKNPLTAASGLMLGGGLIYRGVTGHCTVKKAIEEVEKDEKYTVIEHRYFVK